jgi:hypothetical protein
MPGESINACTRNAEYYIQNIPRHYPPSCRIKLIDVDFPVRSPGLQQWDECATAEVNPGRQQTSTKPTLKFREGVEGFVCEITRKFFRLNVLRTNRRAPSFQNKYRARRADGVSTPALPAHLLNGRQKWGKKETGTVTLQYRTGTSNEYYREHIDIRAMPMTTHWCQCQPLSIPTLG